jgi:hypothetical protein
MRIETLVKKICRAEGKKKQVSIAQIREIVGIISDIYWKKWQFNDGWKVAAPLFMNGQKRAKARAKGKKK